MMAEGDRVFPRLQSKPQVFISYNRADSAFTQRLAEDLRVAGARVWVDYRSVKYEDFVHDIHAGLKDSDYLILVLSPGAVKSFWVQMEVNAALELLEAKRLRAIIPILAQPCGHIWPTWRKFPYYDATSNYLAAAAGLIGQMGLPKRAAIPAIPLRPTDWAQNPSASVPIRRLPVYFVVDTSQYARGVILTQLNGGIHLIHGELLQDRLTVQFAHICVIAFRDLALQSELMPVWDFASFDLTAGGKAAFGAALRTLNRSLEENVVLPNATGKGDYQAQIFIISPGQPTDHWRKHAESLAELRRNERCYVCGLMIGNGDKSVLEQVCDIVLDISQTDPDVIRSLLRFKTIPLAHRQ